MDYIPSNKQGDYISHSEDYLMHYGVKGMKWKDHDYVEDIQTGARKVAGNVKSKIKKLKKFVGKAKAKVIEKVDPKLQEHDYLKNHKVHEEQDKREASMKLAQAKTMYAPNYKGPGLANREGSYPAANYANRIGMNVRANNLKTRAMLSETSKTNKERKTFLRNVNETADKSVNNAIKERLKEFYNVGKYDSKQNARMREESQRIGARDGVMATFRNKYNLRQERLDAEIEKQKDPTYRRATENVKRLESEARPKASTGYYDVSKNKLKKRKIK